MAGETITGRCLCGSARFSAVAAEGEMGACHCEMCRRWTSGVFMGVGVGSSLAFEDESAVGVYRSSEWAERGFCRTCGSCLFWRLADGGHVEVAAQAIDDPERFPFTTEYFVEERPAHYAFANPTVKMTGAELMAQLAPGGDLNG